VRLDLLRSKFVKDIGWKGTVNAGSRWTARHYPIKNRVGTNTFEIAHEHGIDFPTVWPVYRIRLVPNPSQVAQPMLKETQRDTVIQTKKDLEESDLDLYLRLRKEEQEFLAAEAAKQDALLESQAKEKEDKSKRVEVGPEKEQEAAEVEEEEGKEAQPKKKAKKPKLTKEEKAQKKQAEAKLRAEIKAKNDSGERAKRKARPQGTVKDLIAAKNR
jgi:hypothetical protein